jgi:hypothetical protein
MNTIHMNPKTKTYSGKLHKLFQNKYNIREWRTAWICILMLSANFCLKADAPRAKGYFIDNDGNKNEVTILVATFLGKEKNVNVANHQNGFVYLDKKGKKVTVEPHEAKEFGYTYKNEKYIFRYLPDQMQGSFLGIKHVGNFHYVLLDGACQVYQWEIPRTNSSGGTSSVTDFILVKSNEDVYYSRSGGNKMAVNNKNSKSLEEFFADCPDLVAKIKAKEYKKDDDKWIKIADFYNKNCQSGGSVSGDSESE